MLRKFSHFSVLLAMLAVVVVALWAINGSDFMNFGNFQSMAYQMPELGILSLAMMISMLTAGINLSIIATANLAGIVMALLLTNTGVSAGLGEAGTVIVAILAGLAVSALVGALNGVLIAYVDMSPILATLGTSILLGGVSIVLTQGYVISGFSQTMLSIGSGSLLGIPVPLLIFLGCAGIMAVLLNRTPLGTRIYLMGSNPKATFYSGVNNRAVLMRTYIVSSLYAGVAAVVMISRFNSAKADYGESYLLLTVLASVLGGVSAAGGFGKVSGLVLALVILQIISSGLNLMGVSNFLTLTLWGAVLIVVMVVKYLIESLQARRRMA